MPEMKWLSLSSDWINDPKIIRLGDVLSNRFTQCLCMAAKEYKDGFLPDLETCAIFTRRSTDELRRDFQRLIEVGLLDIRALGFEQRYYITNWLEHQKSVEYMERKKTQNRNRVNKHRKLKKPETAVKKEEKKEEEENTYTYTEYALRNAPVMHYKSDGNGATPTGVRRSFRAREVLENVDPEPLATFKAALAPICKQTLWAKTDNDFTDAAFALMGWDAKPGDIPGFQSWWDANGHYPGKPALKSIVNNWNSYMNGATFDQRQRGSLPSVPDPATRVATEY